MTTGGTVVGAADRVLTTAEGHLLARDAVPGETVTQARRER